jgi:hypothetical protein
MPWISKVDTYLTTAERMNNAQLVVNHFVGTDWTKESIAALCGNMSHESTLNPNLYEMGYGHSPDRGYGLVQWTPATKLWDWCNSRGLDWSDGDSQLARIDYEVEQNIQWIPRDAYGDMTFAEFRQNAGNWSVEYLTEAFTWGYERPATWAGEESMPARKAFALKCIDELDWTGTSEGGGYQLAVFPMDVLHVTQGENSEFSHLDNYWAMDFVGTHAQYPYYAPVDSECIGRIDSAAILVWKSQREIMCADGQVRKITWRCIHDDNLLYNVGDKITKGTIMGHSGNSGESSGDHFHLEVYEGETYDVATRADVWLHIYDVFSIKGVTVIDGKGYPWIVSDYVDGTPSNPTDPTDPNNSKTQQNKIVTLLLSDALNGWKF